MSRQSYEILALDGGSIDATRSIATEAGARVIHNRYTRAEPGVALGIQNAKAELAIVMAADNRMHGPRFIERMLEPFTDPEIMVAFPRVVGGKLDNLPNRYISRYSDPFSHFVYGSSQTSIDVMFRQCRTPHNGRYCIIAPSLKAHPLLALAQGCTIRTSRVHGEAIESADDVLPILGIMRSGGKIALVAGAELEHHHVDGLRSFYRKYRGRVRASVGYQQGYLRRVPYMSTARRLRTLAWLPYSATLIPAFIHGMAMGIRRRDPLLLYHPIINTVLLAAVCREVSAVIAKRISGQAKSESVNRN